MLASISRTAAFRFAAVERPKCATIVTGVPLTNAVCGSSYSGVSLLFDGKDTDSLITPYSSCKDCGAGYSLPRSKETEKRASASLMAMSKGASGTSRDATTKVNDQQAKGGVRIIVHTTLDSTEGVGIPLRHVNSNVVTRLPTLLSITTTAAVAAPRLGELASVARRKTFDPMSLNDLSEMTSNTDRDDRTDWQFFGRDLNRCGNFMIIFSV